MSTTTSTMAFAIGTGLWWGGVCLLAAAGALLAVGPASDKAGEVSILEVWDKIKAPPRPELKAVTLEAKTTALLILDIETRTANAERRPRAVASVPRIAGLLAAARAGGAPVAYSLTSRSTPQDILKQVAPRPGEPVVKASVDKFYGTKLEAFLKAKGVKTVIVVGTAAEGAVLHTATAAAIRGFEVVVPIDGMSSGELYAEQYTAWHLVNAPGSRRRTTLSRTDMIRLSK